MSALSTLQERRKALIDRGLAIARPAAAENRHLTPTEQIEFESIQSELDTIDAQCSSSTTTQIGEMLYDPGFRSASANPLAYTRQSLDRLQDALDARSTGRFEAADTEQRAALTTGTVGAPRTWGSNVLAGPRMLHVAAGIPTQDSEVFAQHPTLTLPTALGSVGENVSLAEYAASTAGSVTAARYGRWTDLSRESQVGADAGAIVGAHVVGVALDLDNVLINQVEAAATAVAFTADVPAAIRKSQATVVAATAAGSAADVVILVHPDNVALLEDIAPVSGSGIGEGFPRFSGSMVYPSTAVDTGFVTVANLVAGCRFFIARALATETEADVKTGTVTIATSIIANYGLTLAGFAQKVDVVTP